MNLEISKPQIIPKKWGHEKILGNLDFCGKILFFDQKGNKLSNHFHIIKEEFFYFLNPFIFRYIDPTNAELIEKKVEKGEVIFIPRGLCHQVEALEDNSQIIEISSHDEPSDSYRVFPGDSQK